MAVTRYYTVNGRISGESTGGVRTNYLPDALGSVTAGQLTDNFDIDWTPTSVK